MPARNAPLSYHTTCELVGPEEQGISYLHLQRGISTLVSANIADQACQLPNSTSGPGGGGGGTCCQLAAVWYVASGVWPQVWCVCARALGKGGGGGAGTSIEGPVGTAAGVHRVRVLHGI